MAKTTSSADARSAKANSPPFVHPRSNSSRHAVRLPTAAAVRRTAFEIDGFFFASMGPIVYKYFLGSVSLPSTALAAAVAGLAK